MNRAEAYAILSRELDSWRCRPYEQLVARVDQLESQRTVPVGQEDVTVRVAIRWTDEKHTALRVEAVAEGPSCFRLERMEESIVVSPDETTE